jgi:hypothetical protein
MLGGWMISNIDFFNNKKGENDEVLFGVGIGIDFFCNLWMR